MELSERSLLEITDAEVVDEAISRLGRSRCTCLVEMRSTKRRSPRRARKFRVFGTGEIEIVVVVADAAMQSKNRNHPPVAHKRSISINQLQG